MRANVLRKQPKMSTFETGTVVELRGDTPEEKALIRALDLAYPIGKSLSSTKGWVVLKFVSGSHNPNTAKADLLRKK
jgi:hypothetical protein